MKLNELLVYVQEMKERRGFDKTTLEQEFVLFSEEVGELAHEVWKICKEGNITPERKQKMGHEVVDCLIFLVSLASMAGIDDLERCFWEKEKENAGRFE